MRINNNLNVTILQLSAELTYTTKMCKLNTTQENLANREMSRQSIESELCFKLPSRLRVVSLHKFE